MDVGMILKAAGVGMLVTVACQVLSKAGREEQATLVSLVGIVVMLIFLVGELGTLISLVREVFGL